MRYEAVVTREDGVWLADVPAVPGAHTYARSLPSLFTSIKEVIILMDDLDDDALVDVSVRFEIGDATVTEAVRLAEERARLTEKEAEIQRRTAKLATMLGERGYSVRDIGALVGVTPGRVSQLTKAR